VNTTKLHVIAKALLKDLRTTQSTSLLSNLVAALQKQISQPQQAADQQQVAQHLKTFYGNLDKSQVDEFSPAWRETMRELGVDQEFGENLAERIKGIFERNQITEQVALDEISSIESNIKQIEQNLQKVIDGLVYFKVGEDELNEDECEIGIAVPRAYVHDNLKLFGEELVKLEKMLLVFSELATGRREDLTIRQISSSELSVFLEYAPEVGACMAIAGKELSRCISKYWK